MREVDRVGVIREVLGRRLRQGEASERLGICVRQVKRLVRRYREEGARGLRSRRRGRRASNAIAPELRREILGVVRERYEDFAPTLAREKLTEVHGYGVSVETLRKWMVAEGLWRSKKRPGARVHQSRPRRPALGELVHPPVPRQDPRLPGARSRPDAHPHRRRKKPLPYRRQGPLPPEQTPSSYKPAPDHPRNRWARLHPAPSTPTP